jgi:hypothetical protein
MPPAFRRDAWTAMFLTVTKTTTKTTGALKGATIG